MNSLCPRCDGFYDRGRERLSRRDGTTRICADCCTAEALEQTSQDLTVDTLLWWGYDPRRKTQKEIYVEEGKPVPTVKNAGIKPKVRPKLW